MTTGPEWTHAEEPFLDQLVQMGWKYTTGNLDDPTPTGRESFREVFVTDDLRQAIRRINLDRDGQPWLDDDRITQAVNALTRLGTARPVFPHLQREHTDFCHRDQGHALPISRLDHKAGSPSWRRRAPPERGGMRLACVGRSPKAVGGHVAAPFHGSPGNRRTSDS
ncbi:MAG: hypothetical protein GXP62_09735 [Oligoflexia bacterium]|nr:hypothetical protein [Oligoflexia bacterium]